MGKTLSALVIFFVLAGMSAAQAQAPAAVPAQAPAAVPAQAPAAVPAQAPAAAQAQEPAAAPTAGAPLMPPSPWFVYSVVIAVFVIALVALKLVVAAVQSSKFSLGDALSEEVEITVMKKDANNNEVPAVDKDEKPVTKTVLAGSVSRVVALMGTIALMILFIGFGTFVMYYFATGQGVPKDLDKVENFMISGLTLFAPYVVNKFSSLFDMLQGRRP